VKRRVGQAVDADHLGRHALADLRLVMRIGEDREPGVRVEVDETRGDHQAGRIDRSRDCRKLGSGPQFAQPVGLDHDGAFPARRAGAIYDRAAGG
jgi:hypothetical protein